DHLASDGEAVPVRVVDSSLTELDQPAGPVVGQRPVTFLARVAGGAAGPVVNAGTVAFALDGEAIAGCGSVAVTAGKARCETTIATIGDREIGATYSGSTDLEGSAADPVTQAVVAGPASRVELSRTPSGPVQVGAEMTFRAEVWAAGQPADLGAVTFKAGGSPVESCASVPLTDGSAECVTAFPERGRRDVTAEYVSGSIAIGDSVSDPTSVEVRDRSSIVLSADRTSVEAGEAVTVTSAVAAQHGGTVEGGTVRLESDGCFGCGAATVTEGATTHQVSFRTPGTYLIGGRFAGGEGLDDSEAEALTVTVTAPAACPAVAVDIGSARFRRNGRRLELGLRPSAAATVRFAPRIVFRRAGSTRTIALASKTVRTEGSRTVAFRLKARQARALPRRVRVVASGRARPESCAGSFGPRFSRGVARVATGRAR
ncbi:MAG: Ig-like domain repeat protein, partial [Solirubrobacterales bacterium]|nr:Ig-like domain repeat protein [Solirubrobacterales bacterium]